MQAECRVIGEIQRALAQGVHDGTRNRGLFVVELYRIEPCRPQQLRTRNTHLLHALDESAYHAKRDGGFFGVELPGPTALPAAGVALLRTGRRPHTRRIVRSSYGAREA